MRISTFVCGALLFLSASGAAADVVLSVRVESPDKAVIANSYVALVPEWRPFARPGAELITVDGRARFEVAAGSYTLLAGAPGFSINTRAIRVDAKEPHDVTITLNPLHEVRGTVTDERGSPVLRAHITTLQGAILPTLRDLSPLAAQHLAGDWKTTTDSRGAWSLAVPDGNVPLFFEASNFVGEWRIVIADADHEPNADVRLSPGAFLKIVLDRTDPEIVVTLQREGVASDEDILASEQPRILARHAATQELSWDSLRPGSYGVYAKYPAARYFMQTAVRLGTVRLNAGDRRSSTFQLPPARRPASEIASMFLPATTRKDLGAELEVFGQSADGRRQRMEQFVEDVTGGSLVHFRPDGLSESFYATTADRFFAPATNAPEARRSNEDPIFVTSFPRADAHFSVRFQGAEDLQVPAFGRVLLSDCAGETHVTVPIEIVRRRIGEFRAPAGCATTVLTFDPFESVVADQPLQPGEQSLGELVLNGAASADVRVLRDPTGAAVAGAVVRTTSPLNDGRRIVVRDATTNAEGWAHLTGLPTNQTLRIEATTADGDASEASSVVLPVRGHATVDPLSVPEPAVLIVDARLDESFRARFPAARLVSIFIRPADPERTAERRESAPVPTAPVRFERLRPGRWIVSGVVNVDRSYAPYDVEDLVLEAGETRHLESTLTPTVFDGVVTDAGVGIAARIVIDDGGRKFYINSDAAGRFHAALQKPGSYGVAVARLSAQGNIIPIGDVAFVDASRLIEIAIPAGGSITTRVRRSERPVPQAAVWLSRRQADGGVESVSNRAQTTDADGQTTFRDLAPGLWTFSASDHGAAAEQTVAVASNDASTVDLDLKPKDAIDGTIRDVGGAPLAKAFVDCVFVGPSGNPDHVQTETSPDGLFTLELVAPAPAIAVCSVTDAVGRVEAFNAIPGRTVAVTLAGDSGILRIADWNEHADPRYWLVARDGKAIALGTVAARIGRFGTPLDIAALPAGSWKVVRITTLAQALAIARGAGPAIPATLEIEIRPRMSETFSLSERSSP